MGVGGSYLLCITDADGRHGAIAPATEAATEASKAVAEATKAAAEAAETATVTCLGRGHARAGLSGLDHLSCDLRVALDAAEDARQEALPPRFR